MTTPVLRPLYYYKLSYSNQEIFLRASQFNYLGCMYNDVGGFNSYCSQESVFYPQLPSNIIIH